MVPAAWVTLARLPLSPNGKLDRKALPAPEASLRQAQRPHVAPRTVVEQQLASIWSDVLPTADISAEDDFFELGGHSLLAAQVVARIGDAFQVEIPLRAVFESPTLEGLARVIDNARQDNPHRVLPSVTVAKRDGDLPLSFSQQRLWFLEQLEPGTPLYNVPAAVRLSGPLDVDVLTLAINEIVRRHETLRTVFRSGSGEAVQRILPSLRVDVVVEDLSELAVGQRDEAVDGASRAEARQPFDLLHGPLLRLRLLKLAPAEHVLLLTMHHIICDGWSIGVFLRETAQLYEAFRQGRASPLQDLPIQYADLAIGQRNWLQGETLAEELSFWRDYLAGAPLALDLPTDRPRPAEQTHNGATRHFAIPSALAGSIDRISRQEGATPFMTLLSIFAVLLSRYTNQQDIVIGSPVAGRRTAQAEAPIGLFVNTLPLRLDLSARPSFRQLLARTRDGVLQALAHQDVPFEKLVDELQPVRDTSRTPLFQVVLAMQNMPLPQLRLGELTLTPLPEPDEVAKFDLLLTVQPAGQSLRASLNYNRDLFEDSTIGRMVTHFEQLLRAAMAHPDAPVTTLAMMSDEERLTLDRWNDTATRYPRASSVHELFEQQARLRPDAVAVVDGDRALTYRQLDEQANAWAHRLIEMGLGLETPVGLCVERGAETIVAMLAILKAGAVYVPLDPNLPQERLRFILADTGASIILTQRRFLDRLADAGLRVVCIDESMPGVAGAPRAPVEAAQLAYIMYTSGSTGTPKGVAVTQRGVVRLVCDTNYATFDEHQVFLQMAPLSFDASTLEIWAPLLNGGRLAIVAPGTPSAEELGDALRRYGVTTLWLTAGLFHHVVEQDASLLDPVRQLLAGGDVLSPTHVRRMLERAGLRVLINGYGPTECTTFTCCCPMTSMDEVGHTVSIGRPISNTQVHILDAELQPVPMGVPGELYVGGDGLARGYTKEPALTAEKFTPNPFSQAPGERLYRTGDLARYLADGRIEFLGRTDRQVKIRGFRIEPDEIEAVLMQRADVRAAVAVARADGASDKRLVAYIIPEPGGQPVLGELRQFLQQRMPDYMVPAAFVFLDAFPLTANGKIDRAALPAPESARPLDAAFTAPATDVEAALARIWADLLRLERVGVTDNFFELGGDSILSLQVVSRAQRAGIRLTTKQIFQHQTISQLATVAQAATAAAHAPESQSGNLPLLPAQRWFFELDPPEPHHWNQSVLLAVPGDLNWSALQKALLAVISRHDALRLRFDRDGSQWRQRIGAADEPVPAERIDVAALSPVDRRASIASHCERLQRSLNLQAGPILRTAWFDAGAVQSGRLLIVVHHLATDGVSWRIVLEDLQTAYADDVAGRATELPAPATSLRQWAQRLAEHARCESLRSELSYWRALRPCPEPPVDMHSGANLERSADRVTIELDSAQTESLLREVPQAYHTHIDEVLLTALARMLADWTGSQAIAIDLEGHGREALPDEVDLSRTAGWLTSMYPVVLDLPAGAEPGRALCAIKEQLRAVPNRGIGFGLLRYLADESAAGALKAIRPARIRFNYLGQFDQVLAGGPSALFSPADEPVGAEHSPKALRSHWIEVNALIAAGRLRMDWAYSRDMHRRETIERLAAAYRVTLEELIAHCRSPQAGGATPADFPLAGVDADQLAKIAAMLGRKTQ
jgi:amino acid adenylation domain-containing protein/non-ribosomal peptide synthase protein (TIGR01720 family)